MTSPEVSVVIPTRDRPQFVRRALAVVFAQQAVNVEVIVVDDGGRGDLAGELATWTDRPVKVVRNGPPHSASQARNRGTAEASAPLVAYLDDDDLWAPTRLRAVLDALAAHPSARWAYGSLAHVDSTIRRVVAPIKWAVPSGDVRDALARTNVVVSTALVRAIGGFDRDVLPLDDWELWLRLAAAAPVAVVPEPLVAYVQHATMGSTASYASMSEPMDRLRAKAARSGIAWTPDLDRSWIARWEAVTHRHAGRRLRAARAYGGVALRYRSGADVARAGAALLGEDFMTWVSARRQPASEAPAWIALLRDRLAAEGALGVT